MFDHSLSQLALFFVMSAILYGVILYSAIRRLQRKLGPDANPTIWTYLNELGGYIVVGIAGVAYFVWKLVTA